MLCQDQPRPETNRAPLLPSNGDVRQVGSRPRLLDLYCGAGGCAMGYYLAGFDVVGVDIRPQKRYPFEFHQSDAIEYLLSHGRDFDAIHASPPCQRYSVATNNRGAKRSGHPDLLGPTRNALDSCAVPWVIENVENAPMQPPAVRLCGLMFGLPLFRHRWFESPCLIPRPEHPSHDGHRIGENGMVTLAGHGSTRTGFGDRSRIVPLDCRTKEAWSKAMKIDWMTRDELAQSIPPAYTLFVGRHLLRSISQ